MDPRKLLERAGLEAKGPPQPLYGGDISRVYRLGAYVVKLAPNPPLGLFPAEARGLEALAKRGVRVPRVFFASEEGLILEYLPEGAPDWEGLARMLAGLHRQREAVYWAEAGFLGTFPLPGGEGRDPVRVVVDSLARIPLHARLLTQKSPAPTIVAVTERSPAEKLRRLEEAGAQVLVIPGGPRVDLAALMEELGRREITSVLVEGGGEVHASFLEGRLADKVVWFIAPLIIGGRKAPGPVGGEGFAWLGEAVRLRDVSLARCGEDLCLEGYIRYGGEG